MITLVPNSWGSLREDNDCHEPAGSSKGGQFCSKDVKVGMDVTYKPHERYSWETEEPAPETAVVTGVYNDFVRAGGTPVSYENIHGVAETPVSRGIDAAQDAFTAALTSAGLTTSRSAEPSTRHMLFVNRGPTQVHLVFQPTRRGRSPGGPGKISVVVGSLNGDIAQRNVATLTPGKAPSKQTVASITRYLDGVEAANTRMAKAWAEFKGERAEQVPANPYERAKKAKALKAEYDNAKRRGDFPRMAALSREIRALGGSRLFARNRLATETPD